MKANKLREKTTTKKRNVKVKLKRNKIKSDDFIPVSLPSFAKAAGEKGSVYSESFKCKTFTKYQRKRCQQVQIDPNFPITPKKETT